MMLSTRHCDIAKGVPGTNMNEAIDGSIQFFIADTLYSFIQSLGIFLAILLSSLTFCHASNVDRHDLPILNVGKALSNELLAPYLYEFPDTSGKLELADARHTNQFRPAGNYLRSGFLEGAQWYRLTIENSSENDINIVIQLGVGYVNEATLYTPMADDYYQSDDIGLNSPFHTRALKDPIQSWPVAIKAASKGSYFLRIQTDGGEALRITVSTYDQYLKTLIPKHAIYNLFFGIGLGIIIYNVLLYFVTRELDYGYFVFYVAFSMLCMAVALDGLTAFYFGFDTGEAYRYIFITALMGDIAYLLFIQKFLNTREESPNLHRLNQSLIVGSAVVLAVNISMDDKAVSILGASVIVTSFIYFLVQGYFSLKRGNISAPYYAAANIPLSIGVLLGILASPIFGLIQADISVILIFKLTYVLMIMMISMGLANKINIFKNLEIEAGDRLFQTKLSAYQVNQKAKRAREDNESKEPE